MRVLVCGGREFDNWFLLDQTLTGLYLTAPVKNNKVDFTIIEGEAKGADFLSRVWAKFRMLPYEPYPADWKTHGFKAGFIRNQRMIDEGKPDIVVAFPGGDGTKDMVERAKKAKIDVLDLR